MDDLEQLLGAIEAVPTFLTRYALWVTSDLQGALAGKQGRFPPEKLHAMAVELSRRGTNPAEAISEKNLQKLRDYVPAEAEAQRLEKAKASARTQPEITQPRESVEPTDAVTPSELEPISVWSILERALKLYVANFVHFIAILAVAQVPAALLRPTQTALGVRPAAFVFAVVVFCLGILSQGALVKSVSEAYLGNKTTLSGSYRSALRKLPTLVWATILVLVVIGIGYLFCFAPGIIFSIWLMLTIPAIVLEDMKATQAMGRSKRLVSGYFFKVLWLLIVVGALTLIALLPCFFVRGAVARVAEGDPAVSGAMVRMVFVLVLIILTSIGIASTVVLYYDLRNRKEGLDLATLARSSEPVGPAL